MIFVFSVAKVHYLREKVPCFVTLPWGLTEKRFRLDVEESSESSKGGMVGQLGRCSPSCTERPLLEGVLCPLDPSYRGGESAHLEGTLVLL